MWTKGIYYKNKVKKKLLNYSNLNIDCYSYQKFYVKNKSIRQVRTYHPREKQGWTKLMNRRFRRTVRNINNYDEELWYKGKYNTDYKHKMYDIWYLIY